MKTDPKLADRILRLIDAVPVDSPLPYPLTIEGYDSYVVDEHVRFCFGAKYLTGEPYPGVSRHVPPRIDGITARGREVLRTGALAFPF